MTERHQLLRHLLGTLVYRTQKALRGAPHDFAQFSPGNGVRTPQEIVCHMTSVLGYARAQFIGGGYSIGLCGSMDEEVVRFHEMLAGLAEILEGGAEPSGTTTLRLVQGPFSDAMTHVGQLALLRRLFRHPVEPENFMMARIDASNVGPNQPGPVRPGRRDGSGAAAIEEPDG